MIDRTSAPCLVGPDAVAFTDALRACIAADRHFEAVMAEICKVYAIADPKQLTADTLIARPEPVEFIQPGDPA